MTRSLIVEDEDRISSFIAKGLAAKGLATEGFATEVAGDGYLAVQFVRGGGFDLVILDLGLPHLDGFSALRMIRAERHDLPVIILTARESIEDTVAGLSGGADDYMRKPFAFDELLARVRLRLRPAESQEATVLRAGDVAVDIRTRRGLIGDRTIELSSREFTLLEDFLRHPEGTQSRAAAQPGVGPRLRSRVGCRRRLRPLPAGEARPGRHRDRPRGRLPTAGSVSRRLQVPKMWTPSSPPHLLLIFVSPSTSNVDCDHHQGGNMSFAIALATDLIAIFVLACVLYFRRHRRRDLLLSYVALDIGVVAVTSALGSVEVGVSLGLGLFGILSIIRLRSDQITQQEIAYYFTALALGLLAGLHPSPMWLTPLLSLLVILAIAILDSPLVALTRHRHTVTLDRAITDRSALITHLTEVFDAETVRVEVLDIDMVRDTTLVDVRYKTKPARRSARAEAGLSMKPQVAAGDLAPVLETVYDRITLAQDEQRLTCDLDIATRSGDHSHADPTDVLVETKSPGGVRLWDDLLAQAGIREHKVSKYCVGAALLNPELPATPWNRTLRRCFR